MTGNKPDMISISLVIPRSAREKVEKPAEMWRELKLFFLRLKEEGEISNKRISELLVLYPHAKVILEALK